MLNSVFISTVRVHIPFLSHRPKKGNILDGFVNMSLPSKDVGQFNNMLVDRSTFT